MADSAPLMLFVSLARIRGALPVDAVREVMRPLPVTPLGHAPAWCPGVSIVRGALVPVVDLAALLWSEPDPDARRLVTVALPNGRTLALKVHDVLGVGRLAGTEPLPSLLGAAEAVQGAELDEMVTLALRPARLVSDADWEALSAEVTA